MSKAVCYFGSYNPNYSRNRIIKKGLEANGFKVYECRANGLVLKRYFDLCRAFLKSREKFDSIIVGFPGYFDVFLATLLGKLFSKKVFYDIFASTYETYVLDRKVVGNWSIRAKFFYLIDWLGLKIASFVIVDTISHGKFYTKIYGLSPKKQIVVYLGSDNDYFYPRKVKEKTDVLFYGSYQPLQGAEVIIKAASKIPKVKFKMIGDGQTREQTENFAKSLKLKNVEFVNWLSLKRLSREVSKAKICLGIFGKSTKTDVVIPNKVYDALASKNPIITANSPATRELLVNNKNAILVNPDDYNEISNAIKFLIKNTALGESLSRLGYGLYKKELTPEIVVRPILKYISEPKKN